MTQDFSTKSRRLSQFDHGDIYGPCDRRMMISGDSNERAGPLRVDATQDVGTSTSPDCHPFVASAGSHKATPLRKEVQPKLPIGPTKGLQQASLVSTDAGDELPHSQIPMELEVEDQIRHLIKSDSTAPASMAFGAEGHDGSVADGAIQRRSTVIKVSSTIVTTNNIGVKQLNAPSTGQDNDDDDDHDDDDDKARSCEKGARSSTPDDDKTKHRSLLAVANLSKASVAPMNGAIKLGPADAVNYIPPNSEKSFSSTDDADAAADKNKIISEHGAKSLSSRGSGWGIRIGLRGGGETSVASNGTSGWGPPPNSGAGSGSGWGAPPPPNPVAAAAWGAPNPASVNPDENKPTPAAAPAPGPPQPPPSAMVPAPMGPPAPSSTATTSTSWAAAAGKGLPPPAEPAPSNHGTSKQLEQLNSVREALFSQDGWGGSNVKQDTSWGVGPGGSGDGPAAAKDSNTWGGNRNDGTELWKSNLTGVAQPPKQKPENPWAPANNTDFRTWGEEDSTNAPSNDRDDRDPYWRPNDVGNPGPPGGPFGGPPKPKDDWNAPGGGWNDPRNDPRDAPRGPLSRDPIGGMRDQPGPGWGGGPPPQPRGMSGWGQGPSNPRNWNDESPQPQRRNPTDDPGTGLWAKPHAQGPIGGNPGQSHWKEMPLPNTAMPNMRGPPGPPGPPARMVPPVGKDPWGPPGRWGDEPPSNWGPADDMPKRPGDWGEPTGWPNRNPGPARIRGSPSWEDPSMDHPSAGGWGGMKPGPPKHSLTKEFIWGSKQFHLLCEFGFRKEDVETALRATNMNVEDANDMLKHANVQRQPRYNDPMFNPSVGGDPDLMRRGNFPGHFPTGSQSSYPDAGPGGLLQPNPRDPSMTPAVGGSKMNGAGPLPGSMHPGGRPPTSQQPPTTQQLRLLVQQIQMAVQAGHLNPQILDQPLAPQTLILLNQLLQQIKALQSLQHTHMQAQQMGKRVDIAQLSVNITKTKQQISNLQNQISAQQANYLKQSSSAPAAAPNPFHQQPSSPSDPMSSSIEAMRLTSDPPMTHEHPVVSTNGSRLNQWKLPNQSEENGFSKAPGGSAAKTSVTLPFGGGPWSNKGPPNSGWPETSKPDHGLNGLSDFGIPEFEPGKPWKGPGLKNPDDDPNLTPGSVAPITLASDTKNTTGSEPGLGLNSAWSFGGKSDKSDAWNSLPSGPKPSASASSLTPVGRDLWGKSGRGPLTSTSSPWPTPTSNGMAWSTGQNGMESGNNHPWLLLKNLTAQIDGSTLRTLCMQHGPLKAFHLFLNQSFALVMYTSGQEAAKAQKALNNCLLGNTTIHASITSESDAGQILSNLGGQPSSSTPTRGTTPASTAVTSGSSALGSLSLPKSSSSSDMWSALTATSASGAGGGSLFGGANSVWGAPSDVDEHRTTPLQSFLPSSLLGENNL